MTPNSLNSIPLSPIVPLDETYIPEIMVRAAWLYYVENMNQQEIADCLGISRIKVVRLLKEAREKGVVEIKVQSPITENLRLESKLRSLYPLTNAFVTSAEDEGEPLFKVLAWTAAQIMEQYLKPGIKIGIGIGRTTSYLPDFFAPNKQPDSTVISLAGGLNSQDNVDDSYETILKLAALSGGSAKYIYAPFLVSSAEIRESMLRDKEIERVLNLAKNTDMAVFSVGTPDDYALLFKYHLISLEELTDLRNRGAVGDVLGRYFDETGQELITSFNDRVMGLTVKELSEIPIRLLVAGGNKKRGAIQAAIKAKLANILVTDFNSAEWLIKHAEG